MTNPGVALTIIISCYNTRDLVMDCLRSIYQNPSSESFEIILVDDASTDGCSEMVAAAFPSVRLLRNAVNRNYPFSNNWAIDEARGKYILLLNNDTIVLPGALDGMIAFLREHPEVGVVGCKLLNEDGSTQWSAKTELGPSAAIFGSRSPLTKMFPNNRFSRQQLLHKDSGDAFAVGYVSGAASMMPLTVMREVGPLDDKLWYHIDADYCKRTTDLGYKCYYLPSVSIVHLNHKGGSTANARTRLRYLLMFEVYSFRYYRKHFSRSAWNPMAALVALGLGLHFLVSAIAQAYSELAGVVRWMSQPRRTAG